MPAHTLRGCLCAPYTGQRCYRKGRTREAVSARYHGSGIPPRRLDACVVRMGCQLRRIRCASSGHHRVDPYSNTVVDARRAYRRILLDIRAAFPCTSARAVNGHQAFPDHFLTGCMMGMGPHHTYRFVKE